MRLTTNAKLDAEDLFNHLNKEEAALLIQEMLLIGLEGSTVEEIIIAIKQILLNDEQKEVSEGLE